jgi:hypothetical protein
MKRIVYAVVFSILSFVYLPLTSFAQNIYINEFMASNSTTISDPDFNIYADWIEIYNAEEFSINLKDYYITDDLESPEKYRIPIDIIIQPGGFAIIWADGMDTGNHTNFSLSASGEAIGLYNPSGVIIDSVVFEEQETDISEGRFPDGGSGWHKFSPASPGAANNPDNIFNMLNDPVFSLQGGFYQSSVSLVLSHDEPGVSIHYTTDGSIPTINSYLYSGPIVIDTTTPLRVKAFKGGFVPSRELINTYFVGFESELPVFSLVTDPGNFFSDTLGIYVTGTRGRTGWCSDIPRNWNMTWERPVSLELYETDRSLAFNVMAGTKIFGGCSRIFDQKSLSFFFRGSEYGTGRLHYRLFQDKPILSFNNFLLRSSSQDWWRTMFRDGMVQTVIKGGMNVAYQGYRPTVVFLNGQYWGIHNIREKINEHYLKSYYGVEADNIDLIEISKRVVSNNGDMNAYNAMVDFLTVNDMSLPQNYDYAKSIIDVNDFTDYHIAQIFAANGDYPGSNVKLWRTRNPAGKWRWLIYDLDFTFGGNGQGQYYINTLEQATATDGPSWPNPPWSTLILRKLLDNHEFRNEFIQRFAVHMNTTFDADHIVSVIDSIKGLIAAEIPRHKAKWPQSLSIGSGWENNVEVMRRFAVLRQAELRNHISAKFGLSGTYELTVSRNNPAWGKIYMHDIEVSNNSAVDTFFSNIPLKIRALPMPGYRFVRWEGIINTTAPEAEIVASENSYLTAVFEPGELNVNTLVINEINYRSASSFDTEDWIELYNPVEESVDLSGWRIRDDNPDNTFRFPEGSSISGLGYLVLARDLEKFKALHLNVDNVIGNLSFGLSSDGDRIILLDSGNNLIDSVTYGTSGEWPSEPNGNGPTLALVNPQLDNTLALHWKASANYGTPGRLNDTYSESEDDDIVGIREFLLYDNYPNPFNPSTLIRWQLPEGRNVTLKIYSILGKELFTLIDEYKPAGVYQVEFNPARINGQDLTSGVYFYRLQAGEFSKTKKMMLLK